MNMCFSKEPDTAEVEVCLYFFLFNEQESVICSCHVTVMLCPILTVAIEGVLEIG